MTARACGGHSASAFDFQIEARRKFGAHFRHRQPYFRAVDQSAAPQPVLDRRRAWFGEQQSGEIRNRPPARQRGIAFARHHQVPNQRERFGFDMRGGQNAAVGAIEQRLMIVSVLAGENGEAGRAPAQEFERLLPLTTTILESDDIGMIGNRSIASLPRLTPVR
jgi:hypothetical protein